MHFRSAILSLSSLLISSVLRVVLRFEADVEVSPLLDLLLLYGLELDSLVSSVGWVRVNPGVSSINIL